MIHRFIPNHRRTRAVPLALGFAYLPRFARAAIPQSAGASPSLSSIGDTLAGRGALSLRVVTLVPGSLARRG
jgi:hypothetical protein